MDAFQLLSAIESTDAAIASLQSASAALQQRLHQLQAPLAHVRQQAASLHKRSIRSGDAVNARGGELFHAQLHVSAASPAQPRSSVAAAAAGWHTATAASAADASAVAIGSSASSSASVLLLHVLLSNSSSDSVGSDPRALSLLLQMRIRPFLPAAGQEVLLSHTSAFPAARWSARSTWQATLPIDASTLQHAHVTVSLSLCVHQPSSSSSSGSHGGQFIDVLLSSWTLDALDALAPIMPAASASASVAVAAAVPPAKRQRVDMNGAAASIDAAHTNAATNGSDKSITHAHWQAISGMGGMADESRLLLPPVLPTFPRSAQCPSIYVHHLHWYRTLINVVLLYACSAYSAPLWFTAWLRPPRGSHVSLRPSSLLAPASFSLAFALPLQLDAQWTRVTRSFARNTST